MASNHDHVPIWVVGCGVSQCGGLAGGALPRSRAALRTTEGARRDARPMAANERVTLAVRCTYRLLLRAIERTSRCSVERPRLMQIVRDGTSIAHDPSPCLATPHLRAACPPARRRLLSLAEFRCPEMAKEPHALDEALSILRNFGEREIAMLAHDRRDASKEGELVCPSCEVFSSRR